jgi:hypothetical protein
MEYQVDHMDMKHLQLEQQLSHLHDDLGLVCWFGELMLLLLKYACALVFVVSLFIFF